MTNDFDPDTWTPEEEERSQELMAELGLALFVAQAVEYGLVSLLAAAAMRDNREIPGDEIRKIMDTRYHHTLGKLVREAAGKVDLSDHALGFLEIALPARNWLAHHFYRQYAPAALSEPIHLRAITLIRHARELFEATLDELGKETVRILGEAGISQEEAQQAAEAAMRSVTGMDLSPPQF